MQAVFRVGLDVDLYIFTVTFISLSWSLGLLSKFLGSFLRLTQKPKLQIPGMVY